ncbi:MAG: YARHG domain-containing protein [Polyangiaceae bacterium]
MRRRLLLGCLIWTLGACSAENTAGTSSGASNTASSSARSTPKSSTPPPSKPSTETSSAQTTSSQAVSGQAASATAPAAPERPLYYDREITQEDLAGRTLRELALLRNTIFARQGNVFRRPWLAAYFKAQPWYKPSDKPTAPSKLDEANAKVIAAYDAAIATDELEKRVTTITAHAPSFDEKVELSLLSQRLGRYVGGETTEPTPLEDINRLDKLLTLDDLATLSKRDLRILRNSVYARRGRSFDSKVVRGYFEKAAWYKPRADYSDSLLNEVDNKNIAIIRSVEDSLGGPEHENPDYGKDGWFVQA